MAGDRKVLNAAIDAAQAVADGYDSTIAIEKLTQLRDEIELMIEELEETDEEEDGDDDDDDDDEEGQ